MDAMHISALRKLERAAKALEECAYVGADYYANGGHAARPGVAKHFTAGNHERYGWAPLSPSYAARKAAGLVHAAGGYHYLNPQQKAQVDLIRDIHQRAAKRSFGARKGDSEERRGDLKAFAKEQAKADKAHVESVIARYAGGRQGSKLATFKAQSPLIFGAGARTESTNLPMLVLTGVLRAAVTQQKHQITREGDTAWIIFDGLPEYAIYLHTGTDKMPKRSPVEPNAADAEEVRNAMQRYLDAQLGTGGNVAVSGSTIPGQARVG